MRFYIASSNAHKIREFSRMFAGRGMDCEVLGADALTPSFSPEEDGDSFEANAMIKARALRSLAPKDSYVMADDSGLVVDALNGAPGIRSARYAGVSGSSADAANNAKLLKALSEVPDNLRTARFVCAIALISPDLSENIFKGTVEGIIGRKEAGKGGFGYDPLFILSDRGITTAELSEDEKNSISHRGKAFISMAEFVKKQLKK